MGRVLFPSLDARRNRFPSEADPREDERAATYPPPYPAGWYHLLDADELPRGTARRVECFGSARVVFRSDVDGRVAVLDEACPHAGTSLGAASVSGGCVRCPLHGWRVDGDGRVREIPGSPVPVGLGTRAWPARELSGMVLAYHDPGRPPGTGPLAPPFDLEPLADVDADRLTFRGTYDGGFVKMHLVEFADNSADLRHFSPVHGDMLVPFAGWRVPGVTVNHEVEMRVDAELPHAIRLTDDAVLGVNGRRLPWTGARAEATLFGPCSLNRFRITLPKLGDIVFFHTHLPIRPLLQRVRFRVFADRRIGRLLVLYVVGSWIAQWRRDVAIWEKKVHRSRPVLAPGDGPVPEARRWYSQFRAI